MAGKSPIIKVTVTGDARDLQKALRSAQQSAETFGDKMQNWGRTLTRAITLPIAALGVTAIKAASDLNESIDKTTAIFGESAQQILEWSKTSATAMGLTRDNALDAAAGLGNMIQTAGLAPQAAAEMSMKLVQLAADLGSLNNVDPTDMLVNIRSGLAGEAEPLRKFGVLLSAARVKTKALQMGLADANGELSEAAKVQARYQIILEDSNLAQGNFADTSDGVANQTRILKAEVANLAAELGTNLLPVAENVLGALTDLTAGFSSMSQGTQQAIIKIGLLIAAAGPLLRILGMITGAISAIGGAVSASIGAIAGVFIGVEAGLRRILGHVVDLMDALARATGGTDLIKPVYMEAIQGPTIIGSASRSRTPDVNVKVYLDGNEVGQSITPQIRTDLINTGRRNGSTGIR